METIPLGVYGQSVQLLVVAVFKRGPGLVHIQNLKMGERIVHYWALLWKHRAVTHNLAQLMVASVTGEFSLLVVQLVEEVCSLAAGSVIILLLSTMERTAWDQSMKQGHAIPFTAQLTEITVSGQNSCNAA